ncbi:hypothetical protein Q9R08_01140 [Microbacterium sp. QXD-8]|uniref:Uncharacterized protein n=1 Tax=Microbacterium psychrotolerans TaxID=3068321 RepID=A0ABU0YW82_9MICO|nr:hypothetical protein [Microbacterium sp. QXD-8]MDQ7876572.1 hypothetical protein [Microbacterium sp. QXD-8]
MTDDLGQPPEPEVTAKQRPLDDDPDGYTDDDLSSKDGYLDLLLSMYVGFADEGSGAIGMTLQSNGAVISGIVISRAEWIERVVDSLTASGGGQTAENLGEWYGKMQDNFLEEWNRRDAADLLGRARRFIHMRDVRVLNGADVNLPTWRGSLADVTGWSLGSWNPPMSALPGDGPE